MAIENVIICGLGALGTTYANILKDICKLKVLADRKRVENYKKNPPKFNGKVIELEYITPQEDWNADLIIVATKATGLVSAIEYIKNFITDKTLIISLINGISSEDKIASVYGKDKVVRSFFIGHSAMRNKNSTIQDGIGKIVLEPNEDLELFFSKNNICYEVSQDIIYSQWVKLGVNIILNEPSAVYKMTVGELRNLTEYQSLTINLLNEVKEIAGQCGINIETYNQDVLNSANLIANDGKTSMLQDILANRKTEVDIFSGEIIELGKKYNILTPHNQSIYNKIKQIEEDYR